MDPAVEFACTNRTRWPLDSRRCDIGSTLPKGTSTMRRDESMRHVACRFDSSEHHGSPFD
ncbi:hypothetical protein DIE22_17330 [Burkholderia sp. Bp9142]|nr:hypothetical protein DIE22_17330 [Burkholderia sp. Bp9142]